MTHEQLTSILRHGLEQLLTLPPAALRAKEPWLTRGQVRWCLAHLQECRWDTRAVRDLLARAAALSGSGDTGDGVAGKSCCKRTRTP